MSKEISTVEAKKVLVEWTFGTELHRTVLLLCRALLNKSVISDVIRFCCKFLSNINVLKGKIIPFHNSSM
jgi:hypothetical protein